MKASVLPSPDFQILFESAPGLYLVLTPTLEIAAVSNAYLQATMTKRDEILGRPLFEIFPDNPDDAAATGTRNLKESLQRVLKSKTADTMPVQKYDIRKPESEGGGFEERYWSPLNSPVFNHKEEIVYIIHRVEDVTAFVHLKQKDREQSKLTDELHSRAEKMESEIFLRAQEVAEANRKLEQANKELVRLYEKTKELDRLKTDFFANISHELRTPLTLILGPATQLLGDAATPEPMHRNLEMIQRNAHLLLKHVNDLLDISKLEAGKMSIVYSRSDLAGLTRLVASHFESFASHQKINFVVESPFSLNGETDGDMLQRILLNLLSNAFKFTPEGGTVTLTLEEKHGQAFFSVSDTGLGIPPDLRDTIFERFSQIDSGDRRRIGGTGLGLSIVKEFVTLHGGTIAINEAPHGGSSFIVSIPLKAPSGAVISAEKDFANNYAALSANTELGRPIPGASSSEHPLNHERGAWVLIVEDNPDMNDFLATILAKTYRVERAFTGREGLEKALKSIPDLIIADVMMPEMSGDQMARELLSRPETSDIPLLLLTAKMDDPLKMAMLKEGVRDYIAKPFSTEELLIKVDRLICERRKTLAERGRLIQMLQKSNEDLERFAYTASHDLRSPLRAIDNLSRMIEEDLGKTLQGDNRKSFEKLRQRVKRMEKLLDDILAYAPQYHQKIFEMFQTLQPRDRTEGSGLGLAFVKKILSFYDANITIKSEPGCGAEFRFDWPKTQTSRGGSKEHEEQPYPSTC